MHPKTPKRLYRFAETHRQVGAICNAATWLEYQLETAVAELSRDEGTRDETQGQRWRFLVKYLRRLLREGAVDEPLTTSSLDDLLDRIVVAMGDRDKVVHSTWMVTNDTKPGCVTGQRWRLRSVEYQDWHPDELEGLREDLEALESELSSAAWNAVMPPEQHL